MARISLALTALVLVGVLAVAPAAGTPQKAPTRGGTVVVGVPANSEPACFNVFASACWRGIIGDVDRLIFARPFAYAPGGTQRPDLVSRVTVTKKPVTLTFHIRPEARWSDGRPVTAFDFRFHLKALRTSEVLRTFDPSKEGWIWKVTRWRALDAERFRIWLSEPVELPVLKDYYGAGPRPRHVISAVDLSGPDFWRDTVVDPKTGRPIGSGPFLMQSHKRGQSITLVRNPRYWGPHTSYLDKLVFRFLPTDELADALRRGEIDMILPLGSHTDAVLQEVRRRRPPGVRVDAAPTVRVETLNMRVAGGANPALRMKKVRQALAYGIDRAGLVRTLGRGVFGRTAQPVAPAQSMVHLAQHASYQPNWQRYRYRPALARRLLDQAGCRPGGDGILVCGGERLSLRIGALTDIESRKQTVAFLQDNLRAIGVELKPQYFSVNAVQLADALMGGSLDLAIWAWVFDIGGGSPIPECKDSSNYSGYCSRLYDRELDSAVTLDDAARKAAWNRVDRLLADAVPLLPLYQHTGQVAHRTNLHLPNLDGMVPLWNAADWWLEPDS